MRQFTARFATPEEIEAWDSHVTANPNGGNMLQAKAYAQVKADHGWKPLYLAYETEDYTSYNLVLEKHVPLLGKYWYMIKGPDVASPEDLPGIFEANRNFCREQARGVFAIRIEPDVEASDDTRALLAREGLVKMPDLQPNDHTAIVDISPEPDVVLKSFSSRGRNAVRRAIREGAEVVTAEPTEENFRAMFNLMGQVQQGQKNVQVRSFEYFKAFWGNFIAAGQGRLLFTYEDGKPSVGAFVVNYGRKGTYKDGGSLPRRKQYGDSHLIQWTAMNQLKELGITSYDLCGTPPSSELKNPEHEYYGLGLFKTSFTKTITDFVGCYDQVISPLKYKLWSAAGEKIARGLYVRRRNQPFY